VHLASRGTYSSRRISAELTHPMGVELKRRLVAIVMLNACIRGLCREGQGEAATGCRHGWRPRKPKVSSPQSQRTVGHRHYLASDHLQSSGRHNTDLLEQEHVFVEGLDWCPPSECFRGRLSPCSPRLASRSLISANHPVGAIS